MRRYLVLGAGYTGLRVVRLLQAAGADVIWTNRNGEGGASRFDGTVDSVLTLLPFIRPDTAILHSIPTFTAASGLREITPQLSETWQQTKLDRVVYLSTTGVYGPSQIVDESTLPLPQTNREELRVAAEQAITSGPWSSLILRPAAIYGPNRGIHASMRAGRFRLPENPSNFVSRIHVDDLASHAFAALTSDCEGAYPVADAEPCTALEAAQFCTNLLGVPLPQAVPAAELGETRRADRRVDGSAVRKLLRIELRYPSYKTGFPACLAEEARIRSTS